MLDMRYHIASLVAVFFALAIGILLGTVIVDKGILVKQQQALVQRIETNFNSLRDENRLLKEEVASFKKFEQSVVPLSIKDRLAGQHVAVISTTKVQGDVITDLTEGLQKAGAAVDVIKVKEEFNLSEDAIAKLASYISEPLNAKDARALILKKMADELAVVSAQGPTTTTTTGAQQVAYLEQLKQLGLISFEGAIDQPVTSVVILGGASGNEDPQKTDAVIIAQLKTTGKRIIGVETSGCKTSYMNVYQEAGIPTVDNIDQSAGVIATIYSLGGMNGNFGVKPSADQLMPSLTAQ